MGRFKDKKTIDRSNLPTRFPFILTWLSFLTLHYFRAAGWVWGAVGALLLIIWVLTFVAFSTEQDVDLFNDQKK